MQKFYLCLCEEDAVIDDREGQFFADIDAAVRDAIRQIRNMVAVEIVEKGEADLKRAIEIVGKGGAARRIRFSEAIAVSV